MPARKKTETQTDMVQLATDLVAPMMSAAVSVTQTTTVVAELAEIPDTLPAFELAGPGFYSIDDETYHRGSPGVSKSGLWTIHTKTPAHFQFGERKETEAFQMGSAIHCAILEPEAFETRYVRGPDDRRGNKWTDACAAAAHYGTTCLVAKDYDEALLYREAAHLHPIVRKLTANAKVETAAFAIDEETGEIIKCKPDVFNEGLNIIADLKSSVSASRDDFGKSITNYGYHVQEAMYSDVWTQAGGVPLDGFVFIVIEKTAPFLVAVYEIEPRLVEDGFQIYRSALRKYHECNKLNTWPGYSNSVERIDAPEWYYRQQETKGSN